MGARLDAKVGGAQVLQSSLMTHVDANEQARAAATDFARRLVPSWCDALGSDLIGAYLIGSVAHAGFSARYSDVDVALVTEAGLSPNALDRIYGQAAALSPDWGPKLSIFWADRRFSVGRFPVLDRIDYLDHAIVLVERERVRPARPTLDEVRHYLRGEPFARWADGARRFTAAGALEPDERKAYLRALLYPARFCFSWITGRMGSNDDAVALLNDTPIAGLDVDLIARALACRQRADDPDGLFAARAALLSQIDACAALVAEGREVAH
jgi:predicted nucleotidyltransferase